MKKWLKIVLIGIGVLTFCIVIDIVSIYTLNKPIFAIKDDCDCTDQIYKGLFYDTYNCFEYPTPQIKAKWSKFSCSSLNYKAETNENDGGWYNSQMDFHITKSENQNNIKFKDYYNETNGKVYMSGNIEEFYITNENENDETLENYISNTFQTFDDSIKSITEQMTISSTLKDGGTTTYKSKEKDISIIVCNTIDGNKDVYIGNYNMVYEQNMCK